MIVPDLLGAHPSVLTPGAGRHPDAGGGGKLNG